ncbi:MAG: hypothetical protein M1469_11190 [Bacteroidetes bacterium]|nr:hypothetical protein [Bacteroidota bacterium]
MEATSSGLQNSEVLNTLRRVYRKKILSHIISGIFVTGSALLIVVTFSAFLEAVFDFGTAGRAVLFFASVLVVLFFIIRELVPNLLKYFRKPLTVDIAEVSLEVGNAFPDIKDRLRNAVELLSNKTGRFYSDELALAYIEQIFQGASHLDFGKALRYRSTRTSKLALSGSFAAMFLLFILFLGQSSSALFKVINFTNRFPTPLAYSIEVVPGSTELSRGDTLRITAKLTSLGLKEPPAEITLSERYAGEQDFETHRLKETTSGVYRYELPNLRNTLDYYVSAGDQRTEEYHVKVVDLPIVQSFAVTLVYPAYTHKVAETLQDNIGDFTALIGTRAEFTLHANKELKSAWIAFEDTTKKEFSVNGTSASGSVTVTRTTKYVLRLADDDSLLNRDPIVYSIKAVKDEYPTCEITYPGRDVDLNRDMQLPLKITVSDDYGFTKLLLEYKLISSKYVPPEKNYRQIEIPLPSKSAGSEEISYVWDLTSLSLVPEDVISYHAKVFDNDLVSGPKATVSAEYQLRLPSLNQVFASADSEHSDLISKTEDALSRSDELQQQIDKMSEDMKTATQQLSWEQEKNMQNVLQRFDSLQKKIDNVKKQVESMTQKMLENKIISPQTLEKYLELQKALQEINSPEFQEALKKLQQAIQSLNPNMVRQAMQNFKVNEDMLRKSIERTLNLIKRVEIAQKLDELQKRAGQMVDQQKEIEKSTAGGDSSSTQARDQLSERQKQLEKDLTNTNRAMSDLKKKMSQFASEMPMKKLGEAEENLQKSNVGQKIQDAQQQLAKGDFSKAMSSQQQISSALQDFKQSISEAQKEMMRNQQRETMNALRKAQQNLLDVSKKQESLMNQTEQSSQSPSVTRSLSDKQNELMQELNYTAQQMMQLSNKSFSVTPQMGRQIGQAYGQMQQALNQLQQRSGQSSAADPQRQAMGSMNKAVMTIQNTLQAMMQGQGAPGGSSLMQQLQQLAGQQESLNALTQKLGENGSLTMQQQAELARLAAQQEAIRKSLEQLARETQQSQERERVLGSLDQIAKDMKRVVSDMQSRNIKQETIQRQQQILSRMLDASRSIRQRDYDNQRVARAGKDVTGKSPAELNLTNANSQQEQQLLKLIRQNFPPEYQKIILRYYQLLNKSPD